MATGTAISDHTSTIDEQVEKKLNDEVKAIKQDSVASFMENAEEGNPKVEESLTPATPLSKPEEVSEDKQIGRTIAETKKTDDAPDSGDPVEESPEAEKDFIPDSHTATIPAETVADTIKTQQEEQTAVVSVIKEEPEQVVVPSLQRGQEEKSNTVDGPEPIGEATEKLLEPLNVLPAKESDAVGIEEIKKSDVEPIEVEKPEAKALEAEEKLGKEQSELTTQVEKAFELVETKENVETDTATDAGPLAEMVEDSPLSKEVETIQEEKADFLVGSEQLLTNQEAQTDLKEDGRDFPLSTIVTEKVDVENEKVLSGVDAVGDQLSKEAVIETGKVAEEDGARTLETEDGSEKRNVISEEMTLRPVTEGVNSSISTAEVIDKSFERENTGTDVEVATEGEKREHSEQNVKDEILALAQTNKSGHVEGKQDELTAVASKPLKEVQESVIQVRSEQTLETGEHELEKEEVDENTKSKVQNLEPSVNVGDETKTSQELPKELPAKSTQKQSNNIISKVKQTLVKAKKAIIGKSPSSKTLSSETKGDVKVK